MRVYSASSRCSRTCPVTIAIVAVIAGLMLLFSYKDQILSFISDPVKAIKDWWGGLLQWFYDWFGKYTGMPNPRDNYGSNNGNSSSSGQQNNTIYQNINIESISSDYDVYRLSDLLHSGETNALYSKAYGRVRG